MSRKFWIGLLLSVFGCRLSAQDQDSRFAGASIGIATLSADAQARVTPDLGALSSYKPENGLALNVFGGAHLNDYFSLQGNYIWNSNSLTLTSARFSGAGSAFYQQMRASSQHSVIADALLYFRNRQSWARPYLSAGTGVVHFGSSAIGGPVIQSGLELPPQRSSSNGIALRVAVGLDLRVADGWALRYSFSETLRGNPVSINLSPAGERNLANFQNLLGVVRSF